jgi:Domain of unknown function (DUF892)
VPTPFAYAKCRTRLYAWERRLEAFLLPGAANSRCLSRPALQGQGLVESRAAPGVRKFDETQGYFQRLEQVVETLGDRVRSKHCEGIAGIVEEAQVHSFQSCRSSERSLLRLAEATRGSRRGPPRRARAFGVLAIDRCLHAHVRTGGVADAARPVRN